MAEMANEPTNAVHEAQDPEQVESQKPLEKEDIVDPKEADATEPEDQKESEPALNTQNEADDSEVTSATVVVIEDKSESRIDEPSRPSELEKSAPKTKSTLEPQPLQPQPEIVAEPEQQCDSPPREQVESNNPNGFGKDFNFQMLEENRALKAENQEVVKALELKEEEIANLESALTTLHEELKFLESQEVQSVAKDLAKKNRRLSVQLQRERSRAAQTQIAADKLKSELTAYSHHHMSPKKVVEPLSFSEREEMADKEKDGAAGNGADNEAEMAKLTQKMLSTKNEVMRLKEMVNKVKIALRKEMGVESLDMTEINEIIKTGGSWKGRSEKISILKSKLDETKRELEELRDEQGPTIRTKNDEHRHQVAQMSAERMRQYQRAQDEVEELRAANEKLQSLVKAKNSRIKGLEISANSGRQKLQFFVKKSKTDDSLIDNLQSQLSAQLKLQTSLSKKEKLLSKNSTQISSLSGSIKSQSLKMELLETTIDGMREKIMSLSQRRTDQFKALFEQFHNDEKLYQIRVLEKENETQKDIITTYKKNLANLQKRLSRKSSPRNQETTGNTGSSRMSKSSKVQQLKDKMEAMAQEASLIKGSYLSIIEGKEQEISICRQMIEEQTNTQQNAVKELRQQMQQLQERFVDV